MTKTNFVVVFGKTVVEGTDTLAQANAAKDKWFRNFENCSFTVMTNAEYEHSLASTAVAA